MIYIYIYVCVCLCMIYIYIYGFFPSPQLILNFPLHATRMKKSNAYPRSSGADLYTADDTDQGWGITKGQSGIPFKQFNLSDG